MKYAIICILAIFCIVPQVNAEVWGSDFGVFVTETERPAFAYTITSKFSAEPVFGQIVQKIEVSACYSDRDLGETSETYALRAFGTRAFVYSYRPDYRIYVGIGPGVWTFFNTDGADKASTAFKGEVGWQYRTLDIHLAGDIIALEGPDLYYLYGGLVMGF